MDSTVGHRRIGNPDDKVGDGQRRSYRLQQPTYGYQSLSLAREICDKVSCDGSRSLDKKRTQREAWSYISMDIQSLGGTGLVMWPMYKSYRVDHLFLVT